MKKSPNKSPDLTVVILNFNAGKYLGDGVSSIFRSKLSPNRQLTVIVADNASTDTSLNDLRSLKLENPQIKLIIHENGGNIGFAAGNNRGLEAMDPRSRYVLFLNPDTTVEPNTLGGMIEYFDTHPEVDAATCNVILAVTGQTQPESHRGFPTPWNSFCYFFGFGLPKLFPRSRIFNGYFLGYLDYSRPQIIDACVGAFLMMKKSVGDTCGWWNEKYFFYGEDLDFCYQIKKHGFNLYFLPQFKITHFQGVSSGLKKTKSAASRQTKALVARASTNAMRIFYRENLIQNYPRALQGLVWQGINLLEFYRVFKAKYL